MTSIRARLLALAAVVPLLVGAVLVLVGMTVDRSWSAGGEPDAGGAPVAAAAGADAAQLQAARRAAGEAGAQAGMLASGTGQLAEGTAKLLDGAGELGGVVGQAKGGSQQLADGMVQLQAATGRLGTGATELADGVGGAVDQVVALGALQGQLLAAADDLDRELADSKDPRAGELRAQLSGFRDQVRTADFSGDITNQLTRLKDGSRELANQLAVPGYAYHDGIYEATKGAKDLNAGLGELSGGVDEALSGVEQLDDGARRVDGMAEQNRERVGQVQRALPVARTAAVAGADDAGQDGAGDDGGMLPPLEALLIGALAALGGLAAGLTWARRRGEAVLVGLGSAVAAAAAFWVLSGAGVLAALGALGVGVLVAGAAAVLAALSVAVFGRRAGAAVAVVLAVVQVGLVGWVWRAAAGEDPGAGLQAVSGLTPLHWGTGSLTALGNGGDGVLGWVGCAILAAVVLIGAMVLRVTGGDADDAETGALGEDGRYAGRRARGGEVGSDGDGEYVEGADLADAGNAGGAAAGSHGVGGRAAAVTAGARPEGYEDGDRIYRELRAENSRGGAAENSRGGAAENSRGGAAENSRGGGTAEA